MIVLWLHRILMATGKVVSAIGWLFLLGPMGSRWRARVINICLFKPVFWRSVPVLGEIKSMRVLSLPVGTCYTNAWKDNTHASVSTLLCRFQFWAKNVYLANSFSFFLLSIHLEWTVRFLRLTQLALFSIEPNTGVLRC